MKILSTTQVARQGAAIVARLNAAADALDRALDQAKVVDVDLRGFLRVDSALGAVDDLWRFDAIVVAAVGSATMRESTGLWWWIRKSMAIIDVGIAQAKRDVQLALAAVDQLVTPPAPRVVEPTQWRPARESTDIAIYCDEDVELAILLATQRCAERAMQRAKRNGEVKAASWFEFRELRDEAWLRLVTRPKGPPTTEKRIAKAASRTVARVMRQELRVVEFKVGTNNNAALKEQQDTLDAARTFPAYWDEPVPDDVDDWADHPAMLTEMSVDAVPADIEREADERIYALQLMRINALLDSGYWLDWQQFALRLLLPLGGNVPCTAKQAADLVWTAFNRSTREVDVLDLLRSFWWKLDPDAYNAQLDAEVEDDPLIRSHDKRLRNMRRA